MNIAEQEVQDTPENCKIDTSYKKNHGSSNASDQINSGSFNDEID